MFAALFGKKSTDDGLADIRDLLKRGKATEARELLAERLDEPTAAALLREILVGERENDAAAEIARKLANADHPEALVSQAFLAHLNGNMHAAIQACESALQDNPQLASAHNHLGRALFNVGRPDEALRAFNSAIRLRGDYAEAWHNLGHGQRALGKMDEAINSFEKAVKLAPGYRQARLNLGITLFNADSPVEALECFKALLARDENDPEALVNAGLCMQAIGRFDEARDHFRSAIERDPQRADAYFYLGILLGERGEAVGALEALNEAARLDPQNIDTWIETAAVHEQSNEIDATESALKKAEAIDPNYPALQMELAKLDRRRKQPEAAAKRLQAIDPRSLQPRVAQRYFYELGFALDRIDESDAAFEAFTEANHIASFSARRQLIDETAFPRQCEALQRWYESGALGARTLPEEEQGDLGEDLCFLIGFPRSGTTLLDITLNAHPDVSSIEEKPTLEPLITSLEAYPSDLAMLRAPEINRLREQYREIIGNYLPENRGRLVLDKLPLRGIHVGFIKRLFPKAKLLFSLRHPADVVLSNFMQDYEPNDAFIHFDTIADSAATYDQVMRCWEAAEAALEPEVFYLHYEDLVSKPEETLQKVCDFMGIPWQESMLDVETRMKERQQVRTNSYQQVAEAMYTRASGRWLKYRHHLEPHLDRLRPHAEKFGYEIPENE